MLEKLIEKMNSMEKNINLLVDLYLQQTNSLTTYNEVAKFLGKTRETVYNYIKDGKLLEGKHYFKDDKGIYNDGVDDDPACEEITFAMQRFKGRIANSSVIVSKDLMVKYPFNEDIRYKAVEDYHCWLRIHKEIGYSIKVQAVLLNYRIVEGQISGSKLYMLKTMFMLHREFLDSSLFKAILFTSSHAVGGFINKFVKKGF